MEQNNDRNREHPVLDDRDDRTINDFREETSAELTNDHDKKDFDTRDNDNDFASGTVMGWIGIALSVLSFFMIPILFAGAGIILGIIARMREANTLGYTAIAVGIVSLIVRLFFAPFW